MDNELNRKLIIECENGNLECVEALLSKGADINFRWDVHTYNKNDITPSSIKLIPGGILQEVQDAGNIDPRTGEMYKGDRICPLDIALGYIGDEYFTEPNIELVKILITHNVNIEKANDFSNYDKEDLNNLNIAKATLRYEKLEHSLKAKKSLTKKIKI